MNEPLRLAPIARQPKFAPHLRPSAFYDINAVGVVRKGELERVIGVVASAMAVGETLKCPYDFILASCRE